MHRRPSAITGGTCPTAGWRGTRRQEEAVSRRYSTAMIPTRAQARSTGRDGYPTGRSPRRRGLEGPTALVSRGGHELPARTGSRQDDHDAADPRRGRPRARPPLRRRSRGRGPARGRRTVVGWCALRAARRPRAELPRASHSRWLAGLACGLATFHRASRELPVWQASATQVGGQPVLSWQSEWEHLADWCRDPGVLEVWEELRAQLLEIGQAADGFGFVHDDPHLWTCSSPMTR
jgi:hypothetical protein